MRDPLGTSGYVYDYWRHVFHPKGLPARRWLDYARILATVELNATFYRFPTASTVDGWPALDLSDLLLGRIHCTDAVRDARGAHAAPLE